MRFAIWILLLGALLQSAPAQTSTAQKPPGTPYSADMEENGTDSAGNRRDIKGKMYFSRPHLRMDMQQPGHPLIILLVNTATETTDMLYPGQHKYMEIKADPKHPKEPGGMATEVAAQRSNPCADGSDTICKNVGTEQVNGRTCEHWQITDKKGKAIGEVWFDKSLHVGIKSVSDRGTRELTNVKEGEQPATLFKIPVGYQKIDLGRMMHSRQPRQ